MYGCACSRQTHRSRSARREIPEVLRILFEYLVCACIAGTPALGRVLWCATTTTTKTRVRNTAHGAVPPSVYSEREFPANISARYSAIPVQNIPRASLCMCTNRRGYYLQSTRLCYKAYLNERRVYMEPPRLCSWVQFMWYTLLRAAAVYIPTCASDFVRGISYHNRQTILYKYIFFYWLSRRL